MYFEVSEGEKIDGFHVKVCLLKFRDRATDNLKLVFVYPMTSMLELKKKHKAFFGVENKFC